MPFDQFINGFEFDPETFDLEKFKADAIAEYRKDIEPRDAKIATVTTEKDQLEQKVTKLGAANYDLIQQYGIMDPSKQTPGAAGDDKTSEGPRSFESLFKKE